MSIFLEKPLVADAPQVRPQYVQGGPAVPHQPGMGEMLGQQIASKAVSSGMTHGANALAASTTPGLSSVGTFLGGTAPAVAAPVAGAAGTAGGLGAAGAGAGLAGAGAGAAGMAGLAAVAPWALGGYAVGSMLGLFNDGTSSVPEIDYGPDPLAMRGGGIVPGGIFRNQMGPEQFSPLMMAQYSDVDLAQVSPLMMAQNSGVDLAQFSPAMMLGNALGFNDGGYAGWQKYAHGTDSVPAMLTPNEAVIPAGAAQDPMNQPIIDGMIQQGRMMNDGIPAESPMESEAISVNTPLSGKTKREEMKLMQDMSLKKKSWLADEQRKQEAHKQKMQQDKMKNALSMKQSQE